jgi:hypothetical protein
VLETRIGTLTLNDGGAVHEEQRGSPHWRRL